VHINSEEHEKKTSAKESPQLIRARETLNKKRNPKEEKKEEKDDKEVSSYLNLISFMISQNLSFSQIENILKYFQKAVKDKT